MINKFFYTIKIFPLFLIPILFVSCSFHYDRGLQLESEKRWEEAAIEFRLAIIEDPDNLEKIDALNRVNKHVSEENFLTYKKYLKENKFLKAYKRLEAALTQNPEHKEARLEKSLWRNLLITGKVEFEFSKLSSNLRLADEMILQVKINSPFNKILTGIISSENGIFYIEDFVYRSNLSQLAEYSINSIGLKIKRKSPSGFLHNEFKKFVNFGEISPVKVIGKIRRIDFKKTRNVLDHRPSLLNSAQNKGAWYPPSLLRYEIMFLEDYIRILSKSNRNEFAPSVMYINNSDLRVNIDFGVYHLTMDDISREWSIQRKNYREIEDDYYFSLSSNVALYQYLFYNKVLLFKN